MHLLFTHTYRSTPFLLSLRPTLQTTHDPSASHNTTHSL